MFDDCARNDKIEPIRHRILQPLRHLDLYGGGSRRNHHSVEVHQCDSHVTRTMSGQEARKGQRQGRIASAKVKDLDSFLGEAVSSSLQQVASEFLRSVKRHMIAGSV